MTEQDFYVLHSPHADWTWRGLDKCLCAPTGGPMLFTSAADAAAFVRDCGLKSNYYVAVRVRLASPSVRAPLA